VFFRKPPSDPASPDEPERPRLAALPNRAQQVPAIGIVIAAGDAVYKAVCSHSRGTAGRLEGRAPLVHVCQRIYWLVRAEVTPNCCFRNDIFVGDRM